jgi:hypothetical protein
LLGVLAKGWLDRTEDDPGGDASAGGSVAAGDDPDTYDVLLEFLAILAGGSKEELYDIN